MSARLLKTRIDQLLPCREAGDAGEEAELNDPIIDRSVHHATGSPGALPVRSLGMAGNSSRVRLGST